MANLNRAALIAVALALASSQPMDAELITAIARPCGTDEKTVSNMADELQTARQVAEADMALQITKPITPGRSGIYQNELR